MRLCKECCATVRLTMFRCYRCGRVFPSVSRRAARRTALRGGIVIVVLGCALATFALTG